MVVFRFFSYNEAKSNATGSIFSRSCRYIRVAVSDEQTILEYRWKIVLVVGN
ncbi:MAG: hypothetical protein HOG49_24385 [Candidatus Scalindua sp.]|nr:hypothetical protein [Candidatus Scalindua sp.]